MGRNKFIAEEVKELKADNFIYYPYDGIVSRLL